jgi:predicted TIM-barrel fold metal-dependent hydrolase
MILDCHAYIGKWPYWPLPEETPEQIAGLMERAGIDCALVSSSRSLFVSWADGNVETAAAASALPGKFLAAAVAGPTELSHKLDAHKLDLETEQPRVVRLFPQFHTYHLLYEPFIDELCEQAAAKGIVVQLPLRVLMNWGMPMLDLGLMAAIVERHPRVPWLLTGLNYFHELRAGLALMRRHRTVHMETSCIQGFEAIAKVVAEAGSDRLLFGSGLPFQNPSAGLEKVLRARIPETAREAILGGNACRLLKVETGK